MYNPHVRPKQAERRVEVTIHIPVKLVLFILYTLALLGGSFGVSYAVFEWRDDSPTVARVDGIDARISRLSADFRESLTHSHDDCGGIIALYVQDVTILWHEGTVDGRKITFDDTNQRLDEMYEACR